MATLVLGALGTMFGGPLGGAIGALAGRQIDGAIIGNGSREGPRLKELAITTSTYGTPIGKHYGRMRTSGSIIWATDLQENRESSSGGKGKPKTTEYSYSSSFAVAIASRPIGGIGRIWADGNLLRGAAGDLKTPGSLRVYEGYGDQSQDPLLMSALGASCPAYRHCAYVVFEDLQLEDFGNRIPALTFEVIADEGTLALSDIVDPLVSGARSTRKLKDVSGISYEGGSLLGTLGVIDYLYPLTSDSSGDEFNLSEASAHGLTPIILPPPASAWEENDFGGAEGSTRERQIGSNSRPNAIRYYDTGRDYQIGIQRPEGRSNSSGNEVLEFPGALGADSARFLVNQASARAKWTPDRLRWRIAELDASLIPGAIVRAPGIDGLWVLSGWEWRERGIELDLQRKLPVQLTAASEGSGDPGLPALPPDLISSPTQIRAFELPWHGIGNPDEPHVYAAVSGSNPNWTGAALYSDNSGQLVPIGSSGRGQSVIGHLLTSLPASPAILFNQQASCNIQTQHDGMLLNSVSKAELAQGKNRLLVGTEILQFKEAVQLSETDWRLTGLLRGRAGSEAAALAGHSEGKPVVLLDDNLVRITAEQLPEDHGILLAAIGRGDDDAVLTPINSRGISSQPLSPVHPRISLLENGDLRLSWIRRSRGAWAWHDYVEVPLNEEKELYRVGIGARDNPVAYWLTAVPEIELTQSDINGYSGNAVWVQQIGRISQSSPLLLGLLP
ncbi:hypothetical protein GCM10023115_02640 [Pontixanthobacter gangjinensis]|uniref:Uncharacterized protein n=1 Tax=Pontixanthobacter gangjinensis TaxID=1028742 RepID=A0A6I4SL50_9SPHN|nr:phage tail protein [Pontixanthobacter gangjinensis]MXO55517.1 hypothetical protein [Pontixanthobacter gangjinensis]